MNMYHTVYYTLSQAAKATGKHKSTILRAVQAEKVEGTTKDVHGNYKIPADALHAIYARAPVRTDSAPVADAPERTSETLHNGEAPLRTDAQSDAIDPEASQKDADQLDLLQSTISDLQNRLDKSEADRRQLEEDRRQTEANTKDSTDKLQQLLAMKEASMKEQGMQLANSRKEQKRLESELEVQHRRPTPRITKRKLTLTERLFGGEVEQLHRPRKAG